MNASSGGRVKMSMIFLLGFLWTRPEKKRGEALKILSNLDRNQCAITSLRVWACPCARIFSR